MVGNAGVIDDLRGEDALPAFEPVRHLHTREEGREGGRVRGREGGREWLGWTYLCEVGRGGLEPRV